MVMITKYTEDLAMVTADVIARPHYGNHAATCMISHLGLAQQQAPTVMHYDNCRNCGAPPSRSHGARCAYCGSCATPLVMQAGNNNTLGARA